VRAELAGQRVWAARLAREVRLARQIHHPHVCRVFDFEQADGRAFLVMELADGGTVRDEIRSGTLAARPVAARIADARAVASALDAIHSAGIVHRDLSPQNLLRMGDGRVVLSDFGLAVDVSDSTSSVHGGTVAYMAPEIVRGDRANVASDIWGLGVVIHEMVFGVRPVWSAGLRPQMLEPALGRPLTEEESAVLASCRACTAREPARRITSAAEVGRTLGERPRAPWRRLARRPVVWSVALSVLAASAVGLLRARHAALGVRTALPTATVQSPASKESPLIVPTGEPADWTDVSTVLAEVPERITCTRLLPDQRTLRFVWGSPPRAEDIDLVTRHRVHSPVVPAAYAEGCPDLSPDGKHLVFQGHTSDGRPFAFLSQRLDGKNAVSVVPTAEPSLSSEPTWLASGDAFTLDVDSKHVGIFSIPDSRLTILPEASSEPPVTVFRYIVGDIVYVGAISDLGDTEFVGFSWPSLHERERFSTRKFSLYLGVGLGSKLHYTIPGPDVLAELIEFDRDTGTARRSGRIQGQNIHYPRLARTGLTFVSTRLGGDLAVRTADGTLSFVTTDDRIYAAAHCGGDFIVQRYADPLSVIERIDRSGRLIRRIGAGPFYAAPACSPDGDIVFYVEQPTWRLMRCDQRECRPLQGNSALQGGSAGSLAVSPDGDRLAVMTIDRRGIGVWWMGSEGGEAHYVSETETGCAPGWASAKTLWVSRRRNGQAVWTEVDADSGRETGVKVLSRRGCEDGRADPESPVDPDLRVVFDQTSQLRLLDRKYLQQH
jgi:hypothetical protein